MKKQLFYFVLMIIFSHLSAQEGIDHKTHEAQIKEQIHMMVFAPAKHDTAGQLLPLQTYDQTLDRSMAFIFDSLDKWFKGDLKTLFDEKGVKRPVYFYYANLAMDGQMFRGAGDNHVSYPAFHHAAYIQTFIDWYIYSGDERAFKQAVDLADWNIAHSTPIEYPYGGMPYSTFNKGKAGGFVDGSSIMPDKAAIMALAYLKVFDITGDTKYFNAASSIAERLAANQLPEGNWPFRVNPKTRETQEGYTSSVIYQIKLFDAINQHTGKKIYKKNSENAFHWLMEHPVKTGIWKGYYEDVNAQDNRTNWDCIDVVRYLLEHRNESPDYMNAALSLNTYLSDSIISDGQKFTNSNHQYSPAEGIREQKACFVTMGVHSAHWAVMMADLFSATGDANFKQRAVQTMNFVTYHLQPDGKILVGVDHEHEKYGWAFNQYWFSCHIAADWFLLEFLGQFPEFAPDNENHILAYSAMIRNVRYGKNNIAYTTVNSGVEKIKVSFIPTTIKENGSVLKKGKDGWTFDDKAKVLLVKHGGGTIEIK